MEPEGREGVHRRLLGVAPAPAGDGADHGSSGSGSSSDAMRIMVGVLVTVIICTLLYCVYCWRWRKRNAIRRSLLDSLWPRSSSDLPLMDLASILAATENFSKANKLDPSKSAQLGWSTRHNVILGIARGLLYLHEDSLLKVVHRDLKASNVLLDDKMSPKISDFGMAKIFEDDSDAINTGRVVGTYGYMAPEFALEGVFSVKSDVFSFGVLLLEILSGKRNGALYLEEHQQSLIQDAWKLWTEDRAVEFMDLSLGRSYSKEEAWRCYHVGLLCVQENPDARPTMSNVLLMLISDHMKLPEPAMPPLFTRLRKIPLSAMPLTTKTESTMSPQSINDVSITMVEPR
nr:unnamed protein product [Digitaria exilis]